MIDSAILSQLKALKRHQLVRALEALHETTAQTHSQNLFSYQAQTPLEKPLENAFATYFHNTLPPQDANDSLEEIRTHRILQTTAHTTISEGATFFATHWLASCHLDSKRPYLIATFSGVPFSNSAWSGCLNYSIKTPLNSVLKIESPFFKQALQAQQNRLQDCNDHRLSLIESNMRDTLVYGSQISKRLLEIIQNLQSPLIELIPQHQTNSFVVWANAFFSKPCTSSFTSHTLDLF